VFALASALLSAAAAVIQKKILFRMTALEFSFSVSALILLVSVLVPLSMDVVAIPSQTLLLILGKSALGACAFLLVMLSLEKHQISSALPLLGLTPAAAAFLSMPVLGESLQFREWAAIGLMIGGTFLIENKPAKKNSPHVHDRATLNAHVPIIAALVLFAVSSVADKLLVSTYRIHPLIVLFYQHIVYCLIFGVMLVLRELFHRKFPDALHAASPVVRPDATAISPLPSGELLVASPVVRPDATAISPLPSGELLVASPVVRPDASAISPLPSGRARIQPPFMRTGTSHPNGYQPMPQPFMHTGPSWHAPQKMIQFHILMIIKKGHYG
jgi:drug/metabolite transporter (DMT)-like permease